MWCSRRGFLVAGGGLAVLPALSACGFQPIYAEGAPARALQGRVSVGPLEGRFGFLVRERLLSRLGAPQSPLYRLALGTGIEREERAIRPDNVITRYTLTAATRFSIEELASGTTVFADQVQAFTAYSTVASPFATRAAAEDAERRLATTLADQIVLRLGATAESWTR